MKTTAELNDLDSRTRELVKQAAAGNEVLLTNDHLPIARIVPVSAAQANRSGRAITFASFHLGGLGQLPTRSELAEEMFKTS